MSEDTPMNVLGYTRSLEILQKYAIPLAAAHLVENPDELPTAAAQIGFPLSLKLIAPRFSHKSEAGLVQLGINDPEQLARSAQSLLELGRELCQGEIEGLLVQEMVPNGVEILLGVHRDPQFGPLVMLGAGGTWVELFQDTSMRLLPLTNWDARSMIEELRLSQLLKGYRNQPPTDMDSLQNLVVKVSRLALEQSAWLESLDLNPVMVLPAGQGLKVVDFRLYTRV